MIVYRDMTFCPYHEECKKGKKCGRALTEKVKKGARKWWPIKDEEPPIMYYAEHPDCFEEKE